MRIPLLALVLLGTACTPANPAPTVIVKVMNGGATRKVPARTIPAGKVHAVAVDSPAGSVTVLNGIATEYVVESEIRGQEEADLDRVEIHADPTEAGGLKLGWGVKSGTTDGLSVSFTVAAPPDSTLDLATKAGSVGAVGFAKGMTARTGGGTVTAKGVKGDLDLETAAGSIEATGADGKVRAMTGGGSITVTGPTGAMELATVAGSVSVEGGNGPLMAHSGGGGLSVSGRIGNIALDTNAGTVEVRGAAGRVQVDTRGGSIDIAGALSGDCLARTGAGNISVVLTGAPSLVVDGTTPAGSITTDFPLQVTGQYADKKVAGTLGDGKGGTLHVESGGGSITIRKE